MIPIGATFEVKLNIQLGAMAATVAEVTGFVAGPGSADGGQGVVWAIVHKGAHVALIVPNSPCEGSPDWIEGPLRRSEGEARADLDAFLAVWAEAA